MGDRFRKTKQITQVAAKQQRNITRAQLQVIGLDGAAIHRRARAGFLYRSYPGVYTVGLPPITPLEQAMAAVLAAGPGAVLSHASALCVWGIWKRWERPFHVTVAADRRPKGIRVHRPARLERRDITRQYGVPVTTLARTLLDQAPNMTPKSLTRAINDGRQNAHLRLSALEEVVRRYPHHRGRPALEYCIGIAPERPSRSPFEDDFPAFCARYGLPRPQMNAIVCGYEVDAYFAEEQVVVELDGWGFHSSRVSFEDDRNRDADTLAHGIVTVRITRQRFARDPEQEAKRLHAILERRRQSAA